MAIAIIPVKLLDPVDLTEGQQVNVTMLDERATIQAALGDLIGALILGCGCFGLSSSPEQRRAVSDLRRARLFQHV